MSNSKVVFQAIKSQLQNLSTDEAHAMALMLMEKFCCVTLTDILAEKEIEPFHFDPLLSRLHAHEPLQYVLGESDFYGRKFLVNPSVLIPRPETEILIREVLKSTKKNTRILDIGTGSGCIAITLQLEISDAYVSALDVSAAALTVARENARRFKAPIDFFQVDFLKENLSAAPFDLFVSNPPYVLESEKKSMNKNVVDYEPHRALFVADDDPLIFYQRMAERSITLLRPNGKIFVEINEQLGNQVTQLFQQSGFVVELISDFAGKDRVVVAQRKL